MSIVIWENAGFFSDFVIKAVTEHSQISFYVLKKDKKAILSKINFFFSISCK